ncbi:MAG: hypothetical protein QMD46_08025 [Methanomicrobiales archaeon]|nr:hypothetical protein [Methanomicrobiales archaeon]MDI6877319.1 hypothetical protein [Methanomicrobiales archaeon]
MTGEAKKGGGELPDGLEKQKAHRERIVRTAVASFAGLGVGALSFLLGGEPDAATALQPNASLGIILLVIGIVVQRYIFIALRIDPTTLTTKDWFYQGFMTFAFWYIAWTVLLTPLYFNL